MGRENIIDKMATMGLFGGSLNDDSSKLNDNDELEKKRKDIYLWHSISGSLVHSINIEIKMQLWCL